VAVTAAQLAKIREKLFLVQTGTQLALPSNSPGSGGNDDPMVAALDQMMTLLVTKSPDKFSDLGVGVVDFTSDLMHPKVWLNNEKKPWRIASTGKISVLLSAVQLRDDVRLVKEVTGLTDPTEYDRLFANSDLWAPTNWVHLSTFLQNNEITSRLKPKSAPTKHCPRPSSIFDLTKDPVDFRGPLIADPAAKATVAKKLGWKPGHAMPDLTWPQVTKFDFSELLWLMGDNSDNVAATACISEIGVAYMKAVQRAYGLFDPDNGAHLLLANGYETVPVRPSYKIHGAGASLRPLIDTEHHDVTDALRPPKAADVPKNYTDQKSTQPGSARALVAYLIALMQNKLVSSRNIPGHDNGALACETIRQNLCSGTEKENGGVFPGIGSGLVWEIAQIATVTKQLSKVGLLRFKEGEPELGLSCEFVYVETEQPSSHKKLKYGVILTGRKQAVEHELVPKIHNILLPP
jgi:Beta-lactamase enzyme family